MNKSQRKKFISINENDDKDETVKLVKALNNARALPFGNCGIYNKYDPCADFSIYYEYDLYDGLDIYHQYHSADSDVDNGDRYDNSTDWYKH